VSRGIEPRPVVDHLERDRSGRVRESDARESLEGSSPNSRFLKRLSVRESKRPHWEVAVTRTAILRAGLVAIAVAALLVLAAFYLSGSRAAAGPPQQWSGIGLGYQGDQGTPDGRDAQYDENADNDDDGQGGNGGTP